MGTVSGFFNDPSVMQLKPKAMPAPLDVQRLQADLETIERQGVSISNMDPAIRTIARALRFLVQVAAEG